MGSASGFSFNVIQIVYQLEDWSTIVTLREETLENVRKYSKKVEIMKISTTSN
jgi:hypothetical protein